MTGQGSITNRWIDERRGEMLKYEKSRSGHPGAEDPGAWRGRSNTV